jgi:pyruvate dehydrogenase E2 component (dihydrolipoamide acetyltransferase)
MSDSTNPPGPLAGVKGTTRIEDPSPAQRTIARRSAESRATVPDLELSADVDMAAAVELRAETGYAGTALLVRACALALRETPRANGAYRDGRFELYSRVNIGVTLGTADAYAVPAVLDADQKSLAELSAELDDLAVRASAGELTPPELSGATFTLTDLGAYEIARAPQAAGLAAGAVRELPVVRDGALTTGPVLSLTLVADHRILYGSPAAAFLARIKSLLERASQELV